MTHQDYLDEPDEEVDWMLALAGIEGEVEAELQRRAERDAARQR